MEKFSLTKNEVVEFEGKQYFVTQVDYEYHGELVKYFSSTKGRVMVCENIFITNPIVGEYYQSSSIASLLLLAVEKYTSVHVELTPYPYKKYSRKTRVDVITSERGVTPLIKERGDNGYTSINPSQLVKVIQQA